MLIMQNVSEIKLHKMLNQNLYKRQATVSHIADPKVLLILLMNSISFLFI